jgi:hypothetical protein
VIISIVLLSLLGCLSMMIQDASGTILTIAENRGKNRLAGLMDVTGDLAKFILYGASGTLLITHYGWLGRVFILPILLSGYLTTSAVTRWASGKIVNRTESDLLARVVVLEKRIKALGG